jgi:uncharacterized Ntn-hydrolase superfamily protein
LAGEAAEADDVMQHDLFVSSSSVAHDPEQSQRRICEVNQETTPIFRHWPRVMSKATKRWSLAAALVGASIQTVNTANATYSIVAADMATKEVGAALTSCLQQYGVGTVNLLQAYGSVPAMGAVVAQARVDANQRARKEVERLLGMDLDPAEIIKAITRTTFDSYAEERQYGIVDVRLRSAGFTGTKVTAYKEDRQGAKGNFVYSVQGNLLTSKNVLDQAATAFQSSGCDLAERLMNALEAGGKNKEGDRRCTALSPSIPSDQAVLAVDLPDGTFLLRLQVRDTRPENPLVLLRAKFNEWRKTHPCPGRTPAIDGGDGGRSPPVDAAVSQPWPPDAGAAERPPVSSVQDGAGMSMADAATEMPPPVPEGKADAGGRAGEGDGARPKLGEGGRGQGSAQDGGYEEENSLMRSAPGCHCAAASRSRPAGGAIVMVTLLVGVALGFRAGRPRRAARRTSSNKARTS